MTDRISGLVVVLEDDAREDALEALVAAISQFRGVLEVRTVTSRPGLEPILKTRIKRELRDIVLAALDGTVGE